MTDGSTLLVRCDASVSIGTGHAMRCLALAQAWQDAGGRAVFAMAQATPAVEERLGRESVGVVRLKAEPGSADDAQETVALARGKQASWIVVDGYRFGADYQAVLKRAGLKVLFIDDDGQAGHYSADLVLNQNLHADGDLYLQREPYTRLLMGTPYIMLRRDFTASRGQEHPISPVARRLLVSMGGSDPDNITAKVVEMLQSLEVPGWEAIAVLGQNSPHLTALGDTIRSAGLPIRLVQNVADMAELMQWADITVTAGGTTIWELAFMGAPAVAMTRGEHERMLLQAAARQGVAIDAGPFQAVAPQDLGRIVASLAFDEGRRLEMSKAGRALVDGLGAARVVGILGEIHAIERQKSPGDWV
jgi:UDP-2,4-diacetamido-2,4,6-trideoxy-beta-L-altropyranose hydrolase